MSKSRKVGDGVLYLDDAGNLCRADTWVDADGVTTTVSVIVEMKSQIDGQDSSMDESVNS